MILAVDLGGTKADCALYDGATLVREARIPSRDHAGLAPLLAAFLNGQTVSRACIAVPGPVVEGEAVCVTLGWTVRALELAQVCGTTRVELLNDLVATAYGVKTLGADQLVPIHAARTAEHGTTLVIAPGTGLGVGFLTWAGDAWRAHPSEDGHARFAPTDDDEADLWRFVHQRHGFVSKQEVCSGIGVGTCFRWLDARGRGAMDAALAQRIAQAADITPLVLEGWTNGVERCRLAVERMALNLAQICQDGAMTMLPAGGIILAGGMPPRILPVLQSPAFAQRYLGNREMPHIQAGTAITVATEPRCALLGALARARR